MVDLTGIPIEEVVKKKHVQKLLRISNIHSIKETTT